MRGQPELAQRGGEAEAVDQAEAEADEPAPGDDRLEEQILGGDERDRQRDDRLHEAIG